MIKILFILSSVLFFTKAMGHELVMDKDFPDPSLILAKDDYYYAYATQGMTEESTPRLINLQLARSKDLQAWEYLGEALPVKPMWAKNTQRFWAPHIHFSNDTYYLYYSADPDTGGGLCLAVAVSKSPAGPFVDSGKPMVCGPSFSNIDPMVYQDPKTQKHLLYWGSASDPIRYQPLDKSLLTFESGSESIPLVSSQKGPDAAPYTRLLEGAWILKHEQHFYMFVSGEDCCGLPDPQYAVLVLRSQSPTGPFVWRENDPRKSVVIKGQERFKATGHNSFIHDRSGQLWSFYHGMDAKKPLLNHIIPGDRLNRRVLLRSKIVFEDGWPLAR